MEPIKYCTAVCYNTSYAFLRPSPSIYRHLRCPPRQRLSSRRFRSDFNRVRSKPHGDSRRFFITSGQTCPRSILVKNLHFTCRDAFRETCPTRTEAPLRKTRRRYPGRIRQSPMLARGNGNLFKWDNRHGSPEETKPGSGLTSGFSEEARRVYRETHQLAQTFPNDWLTSPRATETRLGSHRRTIADVF
jgi:hypothetical protein